MRKIMIVALAAALAACGGKEKAPEAPAADAPAKSQPTVSGPASDDAEASADTAWIELLGVWAPKDACADVTQAWTIEAEAFHRHEMHCAVRSIELLGNGVKAVSDCTVEGDNDGAPDIFDFNRQPDASLTIVMEANGAKTEGLFPCSDDMIP